MKSKMEAVRETEEENEMKSEIGIADDDESRVLLMKAFETFEEREAR
jgi:hypothetical protein